MNIKNRYKINKKSKIGENYICPSCNSKFIKSNYQQAFCRNKKGTKCKDKYWNTVMLSRESNTHDYELDSDLDCADCERGWDAHKDAF